MHVVRTKGTIITAMNNYYVMQNASLFKKVDMGE